MQHVKQIVVPQEVRTIVDYITCDLCGQKIKTEREYYADYEVNKVEIEWRHGSVYPDGGSGEVVSVDMCAACFENKLIPWLESFGANPHQREYNF